MRSKPIALGLLTLLVTATVLATAPLPAKADAPYQTQIVTGNNPCQHTSLALDSAGRPRMSYYDSVNHALKYTSWNGASWDTAWVAYVWGGGDTSLALDASGNPRIIYYDEPSLWYASWNPGTGWTTALIDGVGQYPSLALDAYGNPRISYYDEVNGSLEYASWNGSSWDIETVDTGVVGLFTSLALDAFGHPRISYYDQLNGNLKYASWNGSPYWDIATVDSAGDVGLGTSLALDASGNPRICYVDNTYSTYDGPLKYASWDPGTFWSSTTVGTASTTASAMSPSLALSPSGNPCIGYVGSGLQLEYSSFSGSSWSTATVDSHTPGGYPSMRLNNSGRPMFGYADLGSGPGLLKFAYLPPNMTALTPDNGIRGQAVAITDLEGSGFYGTPTVELRKAGSTSMGATGVTVNPAGTKITCTFDIPGDAAAGSWNLSVQNPDGFGGIMANAFTVFAPIALPGVTTVGSGNVTINSARLVGNITANGGEDADQRGFQYRKQGQSEWTDAFESSGPYTPGVFMRDLSGLDPNTTYQFKARAHNSAGWADGDVLTFMTGVGLPTAATDVADNISTSEARLNGEVTYIGGEECDQRGFAYRKLGESTWTNWSRSSGPYGTGGYSHTVTGLDPNTDYEFVARAHNSAGWGGGLPRTFTTNVAVPAVTTDAAFDFTASGARLNAEMTSNGGQDADQRGFLYRRQGDSAWTQWSESAGPYGVGEYYHVVTGLYPNTTYQFKAQVHNSAGSAQGSMLTFTTEVALPAVTTDGAENVTTTGARLNAEMTSNGGQDADQRSFAYRRQGDSTWTQWVESPGPYGPGAFSHAISGLHPDTTYQFEAKAHNSAGWSYGAPLTFRTDSEPVPPTGSTWYLAEGSTAWGFETYISVVNPNSAAVTVDLTYMPASEPNRTQTITMVPNSRATVYPKEFLGKKDFSTKVTCREGLIIAADRDMEWTGPGSSTPEDHSSIGVTTPAQTWYLPEGSANWGFETWLLIQNPNATTAHCQVTYMIEGGGSQTVDHQVGPNSRASFNMATDIGQKDAAIKVQSDVPVVPERSMYRNSRREGSNSIGTTTPTTDFYLAEGSSAWGFTTYVVVQNPNSTPSQVNVSFMTSSGPKSYSGNPVAMPANSRITIRVNDTLPNTDFSTHVTADKPIVAERSMYWNSGTGEACHDSIGLSAPHTIFYLPDGQAGSDVETWTLVQNPNATAVTVKLTYMDSNGGVKTVTDSIPANTRKSYNMADAGVSGMNAIQVSSQTAGKKIMVERSMYFYNRGAGTDTIGAFED